jgi:hypothetical protein
VHGEYFAQVGEKKELRGYEATFRVPNAEKAMSVIVGKLLVPFLQKKDSQCTGVYTHHVDEMLCHGRRLEPNEIPVRWQNKDQLSGYITFHKLPLSVEDYENVGLLRDHVRLAKEEPESFGKIAEKYKMKKDEENALFRLNADILGSVTVKKPVPVWEGGANVPQPAPVTPEVKPIKPKAKKTNRVLPVEKASPEVEELLN